MTSATRRDYLNAYHRQYAKQPARRAYLNDKQREYRIAKQRGKESCPDAADLLHRLCIQSRIRECVDWLLSRERNQQGEKLA